MRRGISRTLHFAINVTGAASTNPHAIVVLTAVACSLPLRVHASQSMNSAETSPFRSKTKPINGSYQATRYFGRQLTSDTSCCRCVAHDLSLIPSKVNHTGFDIELFLLLRNSGVAYNTAAATPDLRKPQLRCSRPQT